MSSIIIAGLCSGALAGVVMIFLSHIAPWFAKGSWVKNLEDPKALGKEITHREAHLLGILVHVIVAIISGAVFGYGVDAGYFGFALLPYLAFIAIMTVLVGVFVLPFEGHGLFGHKLDRWMGVDLVVTNSLWVLLYALFIHLWNL